MKRLARVVLIVLGLVVVSVLTPAPSAQAQFNVYLEDKVVASADSVVNGTVASMTGIELDGTPYTLQTIDVDNAIDGEANGRIRVQIPGGQKADGTIILMSTSAPVHQIGSSIQLALEPAEASLADVIVSATGDDSPVYSIVDGEHGIAALSPAGTLSERASGDYSFNGFARPDFVPPAEFVINASNSGLNADDTRNAVRAGFDRWENDGLSAIDFTYGGSTSATGLDLSSGKTEVSWEFPSAQNALGGSLAIAHLVISGNDYEFDVVMSRNFNWSVGATSGRYDIETVIAHEVGHGLGLSHVNAQSEIMFPSIMIGAVKELGVGDLSGVRQLYPDAGGEAAAEPGHSVAANDSGQLAVAALKADGRLVARRDLGSGFSSWVTLGNPDWASARITISPDGTAYIAGTKEDGRLYTRRWDTNGSWGGWQLHDTGWDPTSMPSIAANNTSVMLAAITSNGELRIKERTSSWGAFATHGAGGWAHADIDVADDGDVWYAAVKADGRLFIRKRIDNRWSGFAGQGLATWASDTAPAISAYADGVVYGAVKADGRLYTRHQISGSWKGFARQGIAEWASVDVAIAEDGTAWLAAEKDWERLYTRNATASGSWQSWSAHGKDTWSTPADPSITISAGQPVLFAVKTAGNLYLRERSASGWGSWAGQPGTDWAIGS